MSAFAAAGLVVGVAGAVAFLTFGRRVLLGWFLRESSRVEQPELAQDTIRTYPMF